MEDFMNGKWIKFGVIALFIAALSVVAVVAYAQNGQPSTKGTSTGGVWSIIADQLGMQPSDLLTQLQSGKTIADLAKEKNISTDTIIDAVVASRQDALNSAVKDGTLTQAQADARVALLKANLAAMFDKPLNTTGFGMGDGFGMHGYGFHGPGMGMPGFGFRGHGFGFHHGWDGDGNNASPGTTTSPESTATPSV